MITGGSWTLRYAENRGFILTVWPQEEPLDGKIKHVEVTVLAPAGDWYDVVCEITQNAITLTVNDEKATASLNAPPKAYEAPLIIGANRPSLNIGAGGWRPFAGSIAKLKLTFQ